MSDETFAQRLRTSRLRKRWSVTDVAAQTDIGVERLLELEDGQQEAAFDEIQVLCRTLHVSADWLLGLRSFSATVSGDNRETAAHQTSQRATTREAFGKRLSMIRTTSGLSQTDVATLSGVHQSRLSFYERGLNVPGLFKAAHLAESLGVSLDWLAGLQGHPDPACDNPQDTA